jgi:hypothetical protein
MIVDKKDNYFKIKFIMERAHDTFIVGFKNVAKQIDENSDDHQKDLSNWLGYVNSLITSLEHHHQTEEKIMFPFFQKHGITFEQEIEQHQQLHKDLDKIKIFLAKSKNNPSFYDSKILKDLFHETEVNLFVHLENEVADLDRTKLEPHIRSDDIKDLISELDKEAKNADPFIIPIYMQCHTTPEYKNWPEFGSFMYYIVLPMLSLKYRGYWKYAPYNIA